VCAGALGRVKPISRVVPLNKIANTQIAIAGLLSFIGMHRRYDLLQNYELALRRN